MQKIDREQLIKVEVAGGAKGNTATATASNNSSATAIVVDNSTVPANALG